MSQIVLKRIELVISRDMIEEVQRSSRTENSKVVDSRSYTSKRRLCSEFAVEGSLRTDVT